MLPVVDVVRGSRLLANQAIYTPLTAITDVFDFYSRDLAANSGHPLMICKTGSALNHSKPDIQISMTNGGKVPLRDTRSKIVTSDPLPGYAFRRHEKPRVCIGSNSVKFDSGELSQRFSSRLLGIERETRSHISFRTYLRLRQFQNSEKRNNWAVC